eukprot:RCo040637
MAGHHGSLQLEFSGHTLTLAVGPHRPFRVFVDEGRWCCGYGQVPAFFVQPQVPTGETGSAQQQQQEQDPRLEEVDVPGIPWKRIDEENGELTVECTLEGQLFSPKGAEVRRVASSVLAGARADLAEAWEHWAVAPLPAAPDGSFRVLRAEL